MRERERRKCMCVIVYETRYRFFFLSRPRLGRPASRAIWCLELYRLFFSLLVFKSPFIFMFFFCSVRRYPRPVLRFNETVWSWRITGQYKVSLPGWLRRPGLLQHRSIFFYLNIHWFIKVINFELFFSVCCTCGLWRSVIRRLFTCCEAITSADIWRNISHLNKSVSKEVKSNRTIPFKNTLFCRQDQVFRESVRCLHGGFRLSPARRPDEPAVPLRPRRPLPRDPFAGRREKGSSFYYPFFFI